ncbi:MAG: hypothetical protein KGO02_03015, partial [Alphaproteobacteria bacterium]|nr:hypothetical protein [Alphaproteobacteria bacterium]
HRQRPESANGVTFVTLEDETGHVNTIVWPKLGERQRKTLIGARLLGIAGTIQKDGDVVQVIAAQLQDYSALLGDLRSVSRDYR